MRKNSHGPPPRGPPLGALALPIEPGRQSARCRRRKWKPARELLLADRHSTLSPLRARLYEIHSMRDDIDRNLNLRNRSRSLREWPGTVAHWAGSSRATMPAELPPLAQRCNALARWLRRRRRGGFGPAGVAA